MIDSFANDWSQVDKARAACHRFLHDLLHEHITIQSTGQTVNDPEAALGFLIEVVADRDGPKLHRILRLAWADHAAHPTKGRWTCVWDAKWAIEAGSIDP